MWSRVVDVMVGCWLTVSPIVFRHRADAPALWANDLAAVAAVIVFVLCSFHRPLRYAHLATIAVGLWLVGFCYAASSASRARLSEPYPRGPDAVDAGDHSEQCQPDPSNRGRRFVERSAR